MKKSDKEITNSQGLRRLFTVVDNQETVTNDDFNIKEKMQELTTAFYKEGITEFSFGRKKRTQTNYIKAKNVQGATYISELDSSGLRIETIIQIPPYNKSDKDTRDKIIKELHSKKHCQDDIADFLDISQSTVSNSLKKNKMDKLK